MDTGSMSGTGQRKNDEDIAQASQSYMAAQEQPRAHPFKQQKCRALQISEESAQAVDVYNLQSPGLVLQDLTLVSLSQPPQPRHRRSCMSIDGQEELGHTAQRQHVWSHASLQSMYRLLSPAL